MDLVEAAVVLISPRFEAAYRALGRSAGETILLDGTLGQVMLHFPRVGYTVKAL